MTTSLKPTIPPLDFTKIENLEKQTVALSDSDETKQKKRDQNIAAQRKVFFDESLSFLESSIKLTASLSSYKKTLSDTIEVHEKYLEHLLKDKMASDARCRHVFIARSEVFKELDAGLCCTKAAKLFVKKLTENAPKTPQKVILSEIDIEIINIVAERNMVLVFKKAIETILIPFAKDPQLFESILDILEKFRGRVIK